MAIHPDVPGLSVGIDVNGEDLPQYNTDEADEEKTVITKYVEAISGVEFGVSVRVDTTKFPFARSVIDFSIEFDGNIGSAWYWDSTHMASGTVALPKVPSTSQRKA
jgi:hypothetical protein